MHFTYQESEDTDKTSLYQGDVLKRTPEIEKILAVVHPHYLKEDYRHFIVLTQSCDLVPRNEGKCASRYVTIAAVRPLKLVIERELQKHLSDPLELEFRFTHNGVKAKMEQFYERLLNNNEPSYFYLHQQPDCDLTEDCCAFLQLAVSTKSEFHYKTLLDAKILELTDSFKHKIGYLVGNLYSRIDTDDWVPDFANAETFYGRLRQGIEGEAVWLQRDIQVKALKQLKSLDPKDRNKEKFSEIITSLGRIKNQKRDSLLAAVVDIMTELNIPPENIGKFRRRLESHSDFQALF